MEFCMERNHELTCSMMVESSPWIPTCPPGDSGLRILVLCAGSRSCSSHRQEGCLWGVQDSGEQITSKICFAELWLWCPMPIFSANWEAEAGGSHDGGHSGQLSEILSQRGWDIAQCSLGLISSTGEKKWEEEKWYPGPKWTLPWIWKNP